MQRVQSYRLCQVTIPVALVSGIALPSLALCFEVNEFVTIDGAVRGLVQHGRYNNATNGKGKKLDRETGSAGVVDLEIEIAPTSRDTFWSRLRFAAGNALNNVGGIQLSPYNGPLQDDVEDINGSGRNYLLEAWYRRTFELGTSSSLAVTGGIIDSTRYIDDNRYASDEDSQFMMPVFATPDNKPGAPSYDPGAAIEVYGNGWSLKGVYMRASNDISDDFDYLGIQAGYHYKTARGPGNFRLFAITTSGRMKEPKHKSFDTTGTGVSFDQELGAGWGIFIRAATQNEQTPTVYDSDVSGGISIGGRYWGRPDDVLGIAYARLNGADGQTIEHSNAAEAYMKFQLMKSIDFTVDIQYEKDFTDSTRSNPQAWIFGGRLNFVF